MSSNQSDQWQRIMHLMRLGRYDDAREELMLWLKDNPRDAQAYATLGEVSHLQGDQMEAGRLAGEAMKLNPELPDASYVAALSFIGRLQIALLPLSPTFCLNHDLGKKAAAMISRAIELDRNNPDYFAVAAHLEIHRSRWGKAEALLHEALTLRPDHEAALRMLAEVHLVQGRQAQAFEVIRSAIQMNPNSASAHDGLGWGYLSEGKYTEARATFLESLRLAPDSIYAQAGLLACVKSIDPLYRFWLRFKLCLRRFPSWVLPSVIVIGLGAAIFLGRMISDHIRAHPADIWMSHLFFVLFLSLLVMPVFLRFWFAWRARRWMEARSSEGEAEYQDASLRFFGMLGAIAGAVVLFLCSNLKLSGLLIGLAPAAGIYLISRDMLVGRPQFLARVYAAIVTVAYPWILLKEAGMAEMPKSPMTGMMLVLLPLLPIVPFLNWDKKSES